MCEDHITFVEEIWRDYYYFSSRYPQLVLCPTTTIEAYSKSCTRINTYQRYNLDITYEEDQEAFRRVQRFRESIIN